MTREILRWRNTTQARESDRRIVLDYSSEQEKDSVENRSWITRSRIRPDMFAQGRASAIVSKSLSILAI